MISANIHELFELRYHESPCNFSRSESKINRHEHLWFVSSETFGKVQNRCPPIREALRAMPLRGRHKPCEPVPSGAEHGLAGLYSGDRSGDSSRHSVQRSHREGFQYRTINAAHTTQGWDTQAAPFRCFSAAMFSTAAVTAGSS
jgi:hypothetical protein